MVEMSSGSNSMSELISQIGKDSQFIGTQREDITNLWNQHSVKIVSFYETEKTPSLEQVGPFLGIGHSIYILISVSCHQGPGRDVARKKQR
jgi:hypothetical protein